MVAHVKSSDAARFIRDNTTGNLVVRGTVTKSGGLIYRMQDGTVWRINAADAEATIHRLGYTPRYVVQPRTPS